MDLNVNVLVLSPCSSDKKYDPNIDCEIIDEHPRDELVQQYNDIVAPAAEMYTGDEHVHVKKAVERLRDLATVDWYIISAGFGLLESDTEIPAYDCTFRKEEIEQVRMRAKRFGYDIDDLTNDETIQAVGHEMGIPQAFTDVLNHEYDILFVVLGEAYLLSVTDALTEIPDQTTAYAFAAEGTKDLIGDCEWVPATKTERQALE
ncbi:MAG: DUF6884 domain-containing protein, partial [Halobacteriaceae archaeon]